MTIDYVYQIGIENQTVRIERDGEMYLVSIGEKKYRVQLERSQSGEIAFSIGNKHYRAYVASDGSRRWVAFDANVIALTKADLTQNRAVRHRSGTDSLNATMPGQVVKVLASEGEVIKRGQPLIVLEAMKMELRLTAPHDGRVIRLLVRPGDIVERGQRLLEVSSE